MISVNLNADISDGEVVFQGDLILSKATDSPEDSGKVKMEFYFRDNFFSIKVPPQELLATIKMLMES